MTEDSMDDTKQNRELPPKRSGIPALGSTLAFARDTYGFYEDLASHGDVVRFSMGTTDMVAVLHPSEIRQILVEAPAQFRKPANAGGVEILSDGLLLTDGEQWKRQRTRLQPMFYRERIETYAETMGTYAAAAADEWGATDGPVDLTQVTSTYTLRVLGKSLFGVDTDEYRRAVRNGANAIRERSSESPVSVDIPTWVPTPGNRRYRRGIDQLEAVVDELLTDARERGGGKDLLSLLVAAAADESDGPTESEIRSQLVTFLFAGHETSATALTWALYEIGRKPRVAERITAEVDDVVDGYATLADLPELEYTEQLIHEVLRRYPPAAAIFRETDDDVKLGDYRVPEDTYLVLPQFHVHTDDRWWTDPMSFDPSRWDGVSDPPGDRPEYAYFPFGGGPRHCIGMRFARMELILALATFVRRCRVDHGNKTVDTDIGSTVSPGDPIEATFERRES